MQPNRVKQTNKVALSHIQEFLSEHPNELIFGALLMDFDDGSVRFITPDCTDESSAEFQQIMDDIIVELAGKVQARQHGEDIPDESN